MSSRDDRRLEDDVPLARGSSMRVTVTLEPEAAAMLEAMASRMDKRWRIGARRAELIEQGIRTIYHRTYGNVPPEDLAQFMETFREHARELARKNAQTMRAKRDNL